jgi:hypothetical protein
LKKVWKVVALAAGGVVSVLFIFTQGKPDLVVIDGETYTLIQVTKTIEIPPQRPTPGPLHRDVAYVFSGPNQAMVWHTKPAGSHWDRKRQGREPLWPSGTRQKFKVATIKLAPNTIALLNGKYRAWHVVDDVDAPTTVLARPTVTYTVTPTP